MSFISKFPTPAAWVQYVRQRRRAMPSTEPLLIVEGVRDRRALLPLVTPATFILPANGKPNLLAAYRELDDEERNGVLFILDCDGSTSDELKGNLDLILTTNRDIESDLVFELDVFDRLSLEYLSDMAETAIAVSQMGKALMADAVHISQLFGAAHDAAESLGLRTKHNSTRGRPKRRLLPSDLQDLHGWCEHPHSVNLNGLTAGMSSALEWSIDQREDAMRLAEELVNRRCGRHDLKHCPACLRAQLVNGHVIVDVCRSMLQIRYGVALETSTIEREFRLAVDLKKLERWRVFERMLAWQDHVEIDLLRIA